MIVLADNDLVHKLACSDLLSELLVWLEVPPNEVWVLPELVFVVRRKIKGNKAALKALKDFLAQTQEIPVAPLEGLARFNHLDPGEQQLLALFASDDHIEKLVTGDKRALTLVGELAAKDAELAARLDGRVDCLESTLLGLIQHFGFDHVNSKILDGLVPDTVISIAFGPTRDQAHAEEALRSYAAPQFFIVKR